MGTKLQSESKGTYFRSSAVNPAILTVLYRVLKMSLFNFELVKKVVIFPLQLINFYGAIGYVEF
jgi:hypothetical protein